MPSPLLHAAMNALDEAIADTDVDIDNVVFLFSHTPEKFPGRTEYENIKAKAKEVDRILMLIEEFGKCHYDGDGVPKEYRQAYKNVARVVDTDMLDRLAVALYDADDACPHRGFKQMAQNIANTLEELYGVIATSEVKD